MAATSTTTTTIKQQLQQILDGGVDRHSYNELVQTIYASFRSIDQAHELLKSMENEIRDGSGKASPGLLEQAGIFSYAQGEFEKAAGFLTRAGQRTEAAHFLGRVLTRLHRFEEALEALEAGRRGEDDFHTDRFVVEALCVLRQTDRAEQLCRSYEGARNEDPDWLFSMGRVMEANGDYGDAMQYYEQALERDERHQGSLFRLAFNCDLNGEDDRAVELYERCAALQPTSLGTLINLGVLYEDRNEYEKAVGCYEKVLAVQPGHVRARLYLKDADASLHASVEEDATRLLSAQERNMDRPIRSFDLSARCRNVLEKMGVETLGDLVGLSESDLMANKNFGMSSLQEIKMLLTRFGKTLQPETESSVASDAGNEEE